MTTDLILCCSPFAAQTVLTRHGMDSTRPTLDTRLLVSGTKMSAADSVSPVICDVDPWICPTHPTDSLLD